MQDRARGSFPWGTLVVNVVGSFLLGVLTGLTVHHGLHGAPRLWFTTGLCGAFTTFSTFTWETVRLVEEGEWRVAAANVAGSLVAGLAAAATGMSLVYVVG
ncbi:MAG TPA: CrcB family protein [Acidimicrobiales bacterium]|nr:CrcB family protein [Acidimicrobiales bacterium]